MRQFELPSAATAATKGMGLVVGARSQPSAFSSQLLNKHRQHAFDLGSLLLELFIMSGLNEFEVSSQEKLIFQLAGRATGDTAEASQLGISIPSASFGQVRWDRRLWFL